MNKLILLVFNNHSDIVLELKKVISEVDSLNKHSWKIISLNYPLDKKLQEDNIKCNFIDDYFFEEDHYSDYSQAIEISDSWFRGSTGNDVTVYRGVSVGVILQRWTVKFFNDFLSNVRTVERILKEENPDEVWLCSSRSEKAWGKVDDPRFFMAIFSALAKNKNITCKEETLSEKTKKMKLKNTTKTFLQKCKSLFYSLVVRRVFFFIKCHLMMRGSKNIINIMLPSPQALNYVGNAVIDRLLNDRKRNVCIWEGETARQRVNLIDISPPFLFRIKWGKEDIAVRIEKQFSDFIKTTSIKELKVFLKVLMQVYQQKIIPLVRSIIFDIERLQCYFKEKRIHLVFSHTDTTVKERTVISVANGHKVPSIVLQHGAAGHYWGFFPLIATKFAAWGEITNGWFSKNGVNKEKISITGAANFDCYIQQMSNKKRNENMKWSGLSDYLLYVAVSGEKLPNGFKHTEQDNARVFNAILDAIEILPEKLLVVKLKPGDPQSGFYQSVIEERRLSNVHLIESTDNGKLLNACGVLITTYSTMALEALYFNKPIIQLKFINKKNLMKNLYEKNILSDSDIIPLEKYGVALGVESPEELRETILKIYEDRRLRQSLVNNGKMFLRKYCYEPDGKASLRVMQHIEQLIQGVW